jgi:hypothetical protein
VSFDFAVNGLTTNKTGIGPKLDETVKSLLLYTIHHDLPSADKNYSLQGVTQSHDSPGEVTSAQSAF